MYQNGVSIIVAPGDYRNIKRTLQSIIDQSLEAYEVIVIDDCYSMSGIHRDFPELNINVMHNGVCSVGARYNTAIHNASKEYIYIVYSGDVFYDEYSLEHLYAKAKRDDCDILLGNYTSFDRNKSPSVTRLSSFPFPDKAALRSSEIPEVLTALAPWNKIYRRNLFQERTIRFDEESTVPEIIFSYACYQKADSISLTERFTYRHQLGNHLRKIDKQSSYDAMHSFHHVLRSIICSGDKGAMRVFFDMVLFYVSNSCIYDFASGMNREEIEELFLNRGSMLRLIPKHIVEGYMACESTDYLMKIYHGDVQEALNLLCGKSLDKYIARKILSQESKKSFGPLEAVRTAYQEFSVPARSASSEKDCVRRDASARMSRLEKSRVRVCWGGGELVEILDSLLPAPCPASDVLRGSHIAMAIAERFAGTGSEHPPASPSSLKVLTFCFSAHEGAGEGSYRRVNALRSIGVDARLVSLISTRKELFVGRLEPAFFGASFPSGTYANRQWFSSCALSKKGSFKGSEFFSNTAAAVDFRAMAPLIEWADVVHLHWVACFLDYKHIAEVLGDKPVVWTLADMAPFTGGCHYSEGCDGFTAKCEVCPQFDGEDALLPHELWEEKESAYGKLNLHIICPSPGTATLARHSSLFRNKPVYHIPNAYPTHLFTPLDRLQAREYFGLPKDKKILLFGAVSQNSPRKGGRLLQHALHLFRRRYANPEEVLIVTFGQNRVETDFPLCNLGYVPQNFLPLVYSAADVYLLPAIEDNAPLTAGEALLCGVPTVGFSSISHLSVLGTHKKTVYIADAFDVEDFAAGIEWGLRVGKTEEERLCIRMTAQRQCSPQVSAGRHLALYHQILGREEEGGAPPPPEDDICFSTWSFERKATTDFINSLTSDESGNSSSLRHWVVRHADRAQRSSLFSQHYDFNEFTYARVSHMKKLIAGYLIKEDKSELSLETCDLESYQDALCAAFIDQMFPERARILDIGGGMSKVLAHYSYHDAHECWSAGGFMGLGNYHAQRPVNPKYQVIPACVGEFSSELPDAFFDVVLSSSTEGDIEDAGLFQSILADIQRILKPGGYSMHLVGFGYKKDAPRVMRGIAGYFFDNVSTLNAFVAPDDFAHREDLYFMSRYQYDLRWKCRLGQGYAEFGSPGCLNVFWRKNTK